jgi:hypothetical protein
MKIGDITEENGVRLLVCAEEGGSCVGCHFNGNTCTGKLDCEGYNSNDADACIFKLALEPRKPGAMVYVNETARRLMDLSVDRTQLEMIEGMITMSISTLETIKVVRSVLDTSLLQAKTLVEEVTQHGLSNFHEED